MPSLFQILKTSKLGPQAAPDMLTALVAKNRAGEKTQTMTGTPPLTFKADGKPLISWSMKGNGQQTGTPTPDNPVMPEFVGVRTGNLAHTGWAQDFVNRINDSDKALIVTDEGRECLQFFVSAGYREYDTKYIFKTEWNENTRYTISFYGKRPSSMTAATVARLYYTDNTFENINVPSANIGNYAKYTVVSAAGKTVKSLCAHYSSGSFIIDINTFMVNTGSTALPYEPYGYKIPITCAGQTVPVYLGQTQTVRRIKCVDLGTLTYTKTGSGNFSATLGDGKIVGNSEIAPAICSHFKVVSANNYATTPHSLCAAINSRSVVSINKTGFEEMTAGEFKSVMSGVLLWYALRTEQTGIVNEPLCKIGDYADELSSEDAAVTIPTAKGQNTLTVDTELQPSEMTITGHIKRMQFVYVTDSDGVYCFDSDGVQIIEEV